MTYISNAYTTEENTNRCWATKYGKTIMLNMNFALTSTIPAGTEAVVGRFEGLHTALTCYHQATFQGDPSKAIIFSFSETENGIQVSANNYMAGITAPAGFYRTTVVLAST